MFLESRLVCSALGGMLSVDKGVVLLAILFGMCERNLYVLTRHVHYRVQRFLRHGVDKQVFQSVAALYPLSVIHDGESRVKVSIVPEHGFHDVVMEGVVLEKVVAIIGLEEDVRTILIVRLACLVAFQNTLLEHQVAHHAVPVALYLKTGTEGVHRLHADTVQSDALLESLRVVLSTCVQYGDSLDELSLRYAAAIVAHADTQVVLDVDLNAVAGIHLELIDRVVDNLLQQHVNAVLRQ